MFITLNNRCKQKLFFVNPSLRPLTNSLPLEWMKKAEIWWKPLAKDGLVYWEFFRETAVGMVRTSDFLYRLIGHTSISVTGLPDIQGPISNPVSSLPDIYGQISGIRPGIRSYIRYPALFFARYPVSGRILCLISCFIRMSRRPDIRYPTQAGYSVTSMISGASLDSRRGWCCTL